MLKVGLVNLAKSGPRVVIRNIIPTHPKGLWSYSIKSHPFLCGLIYFPTCDVILYPSNLILRVGLARDKEKPCLALACSGVHGGANKVLCCGLGHWPAPAEHMQ